MFIGEEVGDGEVLLSGAGEESGNCSRGNSSVGESPIPWSYGNRRGRGEEFFSFELFVFSGERGSVLGEEDSR